MTVIGTRVPYFIAVAWSDLAEDDLDQARVELTRHAEHTRTLPGFVSTSLLQRRPQFPVPVDDDGSIRLLEYAQWVSAPDHARFVESTSSPSRNARRSGFGAYQLDAVVPHGARLNITADDSQLTLVVIMEPLPGEQAFVNKFNQEETHDFFSAFDGFVGVAFHLGAGGQVLEYLQWESMQAMTAATSLPRFAAHLEANAKHCMSTDFGVYDVLLTITGPPRAS